MCQCCRLDRLESFAIRLAVYNNAEIHIMSARINSPARLAFNLHGL